MKRTVSQSRIDTTEIRYRTVLEGDLCSRVGHDNRVAFNEMFRLLYETPDLIACGPGLPSQVNIRYNGKCWVAEAEAVFPAPPVEK